MKIVKVNLGRRSYDILIDEGLLDRSAEALKQRDIGKRIFLVANTTVYDLYGADLEEKWSKAGFSVIHLLIPDGERHKNLQTVENIYTYLIAQRADRNSILAALGGGVTGDVVGFVAATFMRGVPYLQIPTTLLAQVDSSVGGKTGVNHRLGKNLIGAFYQPSLVCVDTQSLISLPEREFRAGMFEVLKYGLIYDLQFFETLYDHLEEIKKRDPEVLETVISRCCEIKAEVISIDEREQNLRRILNFGHTLGHALEAATEYERFKHGEAVAYGMLATARMSHEWSSLSADSLAMIEKTILEVADLPGAEDVSFSKILECIKSDKKRQDDQIVYVLLKEIGKTDIQSGLDESRIESIWKETVARVAD